MIHTTTPDKLIPGDAVVLPSGSIILVKEIITLGCGRTIAVITPHDTRAYFDITDQIERLSQ